ncbi:MAG TPA: 4-(cytidine 5'-diphospho)-2-C-methyl-D-erythritol kinase [Marmoricola sp.]|nr:4-(cytidine 5'-diphospho)-2-C-methyl-D-erythritol kinase [Marmoricola sp.]
MSAVTVRAAAKINLHLGVGSVREDGYHPLVTVYQAIGLYDDLTVVPAAQWSVDVAPVGSLDTATVPVDADNIALRAARRLAAHHGVDECAALSIGKGIPVAGGMAGGSADAAAALVALDRLWDLGTSDEELLAIAAELGSDVPFALLGGTALGTGRGELVEPVPDHGSWWWVVVPSSRGLSTPAVYREFDRLGLGGVLPVPQALLDALASGDRAALADALANDLEAAAVSLRPDLAQVRDAGLAAGALTMLLSGSGPTWLALCHDRDHAHDVRSHLVADGFPDVVAAPGPVAGAHVVEYA